MRVKRKTEQHDFPFFFEKNEKMVGGDLQLHVEIEDRLKETEENGNDLQRA